ncbi:MAG: recombinase family protein, partial [Lachnospiraceae bacterium]|nr:recombinase family protein [Lachnospiraceae bacterium]
MKRVAIYNRCSTEEESQISALAVQVQESREIALSKGWEITGQYVESQSGTTADKRPEYCRMLADAQRREFDIVMIKSIDRLTRSAKDWYLFLDHISRHDIQLYLYLEQKFYVSEDALLTGIKAILAEQFSKDLSQKIKNAHRRRQEKQSGYNLTREMYGFRRIGKDAYEIVEEEADYIRMAFALAELGYGYRRISNTLYEQGARSRTGGRISETQWRNLIHSPRMHG